MQDAVVNLIRVSLRDHQRFGHADAAHAAISSGARCPARPIPARRAAPTTTSIIYAQPQMWQALLERDGPAGAGRRSALQDAGGALGEPRRR